VCLFSTLQTSPFFSPRSIAVVGTSEKVGVGETNLQRLPQLITDFHKIEVFGINPLIVFEDENEAFTLGVHVSLGNGSDPLIN
jgi:hypothetical protein